VFGKDILKFFDLLPFKYIIYFPINILNGKLPVEAILSRIAIQFLWILLLALVSNILWKVGMKKYIAIGG
jgi:ABC-type uncharacterized transport system, permease component